MPDKESRWLDKRILSFIQKYRTGRAPGMAFEWLALKVFSHQFERNGHYQKFCRMQDKTPRNVRSWKEIPALPALAFKELVLAAFPAKERTRVFRTSGTTGQARGAHFFDTLKLYEHSILPPFEKYMLFDIVPSATKASAAAAFYFLIRSSRNAADSSLSCMMEVVDRHFGEGRGKYYVKKNQPEFEALASDLKREKGKVVLFSTALALKGFLDHLKAKGLKLRLKRGSRLMETGGFKGRAGEVPKRLLYTMCQKYLGLPRTHCISEYGMTELSSQMYAVASGVFHGPAWLRTLVIDPATGREAKKGRTGLLRHIDLANRGSVLAVQTEDLGYASGEGFQLAGRAKDSDLRGCSLAYEDFIRRGQ